MIIDDDIGKELGSGGTGTVYEGPENTVYKVTRGEEIANLDITKEFFTLARLQDIPGLAVPQLRDGGSLPDGRKFIQMDKIEGEGLGVVLKSLDREQIGQVRDQVSSIFNTLSDLGMYHGDAGGLDNYLVAQDGGEIHVSLVDFVEGGTDPSGLMAKEDARIIDKILSCQMNTL